MASETVREMRKHTLPPGIIADFGGENVQLNRFTIKCWADTLEAEELGWSCCRECVEKAEQRIAELEGADECCKNLQKSEMHLRELFREYFARAEAAEVRVADLEEVLNRIRELADDPVEDNSDAIVDVVNEAIGPAVIADEDADPE